MLVSTCELSAQSDGFGSSSAGSGNLKGIDRWAFRVNALELLCTVPNVNAEFDLSSSPYNRATLGLTVKYNWDTRHSVAPPLVFNMFEVRPEFRWWYRRAPKEDQASQGRERAFFLGAYVHGGTYSIKPGKYGIQGPLWGVGALWGYDFPLYTYRRFAIDFELGIAAGLGVTSYDAFTMNRNGSDYVIAPERSRSLHVCPFPVLSEIKACFVFRSLSIKDKYKKVDSRKVILRQEKEDAKRLAAEKKAEEKAAKKSAKEAAKAEKESVKREEKIAVKRADKKASKESAEIGRGEE